MDLEIYFIEIKIIVVKQKYYYYDDKTIIEVGNIQNADSLGFCVPEKLLTVVAIKLLSKKII